MRLSRIEIFPIKSLDGLAVTEARITEGGILEHDRTHAIVDREGRVVNGKRTPRVHQVRCAFDPAVTTVRFSAAGQASVQFHLEDVLPIGKWLGEFFGFPVTLEHNAYNGFPDDDEASGPTIVSEASLRSIQEWYPGLALDSIRRRFRTNLELGDGPPFGEDVLFGSTGERRPFQIGPVKFLGHNPCQRCVVPTRDPDTGDVTSGFREAFVELRQQHLPACANAERFNHFYRFAVNTSIPSGEAGKILRVGDQVVAAG